MDKSRKLKTVLKTDWVGSHLICSRQIILIRKLSPDSPTDESDLNDFESRFEHDTTAGDEAITHQVMCETLESAWGWGDRQGDMDLPLVEYSIDFPPGVDYSNPSEFVDMCDKIQRYVISEVS